MPRPLPLYKGFAQEPCPQDLATKWLRTLLTQHGVPAEKAALLTIHSLRAAVSDMAYAAGVPRQTRRYLGHWASGDTADNYVRQHKAAILQCWAKLQQTADVPAAPTESSEQRAPPTPQGDEPPTQDAEQDHKIDLLPLLRDGTYQIGRAKTRQYAAAKKRGGYTLHVFDDSFRALGCGWNPPRDRIVLKDPDDPAEQELHLASSASRTSTPPH